MYAGVHASFVCPRRLRTQRLRRRFVDFGLRPSQVCGEGARFLSVAMAFLGLPALRRAAPLASLAARRVSPAAAVAQRRWFCADRRPDETAQPLSMHFRTSQLPHPLLAKPHERGEAGYDEEKSIVELMHNHVWSESEIAERLANLHQHRPETPSDRVMQVAMHTLYKSFNWVTGFRPKNTPVRAVEWRLSLHHAEPFDSGTPGRSAGVSQHMFLACGLVAVGP